MECRGCGGWTTAVDAMETRVEGEGGGVDGGGRCRGIRGAEGVGT